MCILLKLHHAKFDVSRLFCSKVIEGNLWGVGSTPLGKGRVKQGKGQNKWILESTYSLVAAMLGVASGRGSRLKIG